MSAPDEKLVLGGTLPRLLQLFTDTLTTGNSRVVITWPTPLEAPALLHQASVLWHVVDREYDPEELSPAEKLTSLATLVWPFTARSQRCFDTLLVDRIPIVAHNTKRRCSNGCRDYHTLLEQLRYLNPERKTGRCLTEHQMKRLEQSVGNQHPTLGEIAPVLIIGNNMRASITTCGKNFYRRALRFMRGRITEIYESLYLPASAPYLLMGLPPETDNIRCNMIVNDRLPDIVLLDLPLAEKCYGEKWTEKTESIISVIKKIAHSQKKPMPPLFVIAGGAESAHRFRTEVPTERLMTDLVVNTSPDPLSANKHATRGARVPGYIVTPLASHLTSLLWRGHRLATDMEEVDTRTAETVRMMQHFLRRMICSPGGMDEFKQYLLDADIRTGIHLDPLGMTARLREQVRLGRAGMSDSQVNGFIDDFNDVLGQLVETTPANRFLDQLVRTERDRNSRVNSLYSQPRRSLVALPDGLTERFARALLAKRGHADESWLRLTNCKKGINDWSGRLGEFDKVYFIMPRWDTIERLLAWETTPGTVQIVCDEATVQSLRKKVAWIKDRRLFHALAARMNSLCIAFDEALEHAEFDFAPDDIASSYQSSFYNGEGRPLKLVTASGKHIHLHEGTRIVCYNVEAEPRPFTCCKACDVEQGDTVFVIDEEYAQMVARHCSVSRAAPEWLRAYHNLIKVAQQAFPGESVRDKAKNVLEQMKKRGTSDLPDITSVVNWLNVDVLLGESLDDVRPHAPRTRDMFDRFVEVLGVAQVVADTFWNQAIKATRSLRIRAGFSALNFSIDVLTDPDRAMADWSGGNDDLCLCGTYAREGLEEVEDIIKEDKA